MKLCAADIFLECFHQKVFFTIVDEMVFFFDKFYYVFFKSPSLLLHSCTAEYLRQAANRLKMLHYLPHIMALSHLVQFGNGACCSTLSSLVALVPVGEFTCLTLLME